jgi:FkbM family methyltransferase
MNSYQTEPARLSRQQLLDSYRAVVGCSQPDEPGKFYGQFGEDHILTRFFTGVQAGFFVEVGAYDGTDMSNTLALERRGWRGILVEADPELAERCREARPGSIVVNCAATGPGSPKELSFSIAVGCKGLSSVRVDEARLARVQHYTGSAVIQEVTVAARTMDEILQEHQVSRIDFITIDVEGHELEVLQGTDLGRWKPTVVIIERNTTFLSSRLLAQLHKHGYRYVISTGPNDWFLLDRPSTAAGLRYWMWLLSTQYALTALRVLKRSVKTRLRRVVRRDN